MSQLARTEWQDGRAAGTGELVDRLATRVEVRREAGLSDLSADAMLDIAGESHLIMSGWDAADLAELYRLADEVEAETAAREAARA